MTFSLGDGEGEIKEGFLEEEALKPSHCTGLGMFTNIPFPKEKLKKGKDKQR